MTESEVVGTKEKKKDNMVKYGRMLLCKINMK